MTLRLERLAVAQGGRPLIAVDAAATADAPLTLMGPSGAGKSVLLSAVVGAAPPGFAVTGRVLLDGRDLAGLPPEERRIGLMFQDDLLFPHLSVGGNLAFALPAAIRGRAARRARVEAALAAAGLPGLADRDPATLSGGQRARVALMRALLAEPRALLLDEPFSRLDAELRASFRAHVFAEARARGLPVVMVTHDAADAAAAGGRVIRL